ncbi:MAG TPA: hypothetical protein VGE90_14765, partial [Chitinophaga sp.]
IICHGEVLYSGEPETAVAALEGKIYSRKIRQDEIELYRQQYPIISTQLKAGHLHIRITSPDDPGNGFVPAEPSLEDVYFTYIATKMDVYTL